ncbi:MAG: amino acid permease [Dyadobacter sp. 50-39]|uniref:APC family permease n=1 Tax=Dyadobacter sp. 50-39 TaxID=1895756 RepID=UPI000964AFB8|nr:APC family permease [Dyadobacter sp. 50-39]OJV15244.1 MAG: amino acid permease [Dyadobacter sp. 50-39]
MQNHKKLNELAATAICGNDITSSCLYVSSLTIIYAGQYAWLALLLVAIVLFVFRKIYGEVVGALPLNGGAYNVLLNTTSKSNASIAACLTILSYMATAVISASEAMHYLHGILPGVPVLLATAVLITLFLFLVMSGISESSIVAVIIFILHITAMILLIGSAGWYILKNGLDIAISNFQMPAHGSLATALFFGFSTAMLGISGFESSANFVEEQQQGVFRKTLRNMWVAVSLINPLMALAAVSVLPLAEVAEHQEALLSHLGNQTAGSWLAMFISVDAVLVLSGALLTSYVGVNGLIRRMTLDRILPQFLLKENSRGSSPRILGVFYLLCLSVLFITQGQLGPLAGVYTISFLLVMIYFGFGNFLLKLKRARLPRPERAPVMSVAFALLAVMVALYGNVRLHADYLIVFLQYFLPALVLIMLLLSRNEILQYALRFLDGFFTGVKRFIIVAKWHLTRSLKRLTEQEFVYFTKGDDISILNKVMIYVQENEITKKLKIVTVLNDGGHVSEDFLRDLDVLDRAYPEIKIEYTQVHGVFGPEIIQRLSAQWNIPINFMFISSPSDRFSHRVSDLGGVRLII